MYGPKCIPMRKLLRWVKSFKAGKLSVRDRHLSKPKTTIT